MFFFLCISCVRAPIVLGGEEVKVPGKKITNELREKIRNSAESGAKWLSNFRNPSGEFKYGWIPSLNRPLEGNNDLRQAGAALALARAARILRDTALEKAARDSILHLIETRTELILGDDNKRQPTTTKTTGNPVGLSGLLLAAVSELPRQDDLALRYSDELSRFLRSRQRKDGSLFLGVGEDDEDDDIASIDFYPGEALLGLMRGKGKAGNQNANTVERSFDFYRNHFEHHRSPAFVPWQTQVFADVYLRTKDPKYAAFVFEMTDFILRFQHSDQHHAEWAGGFGDCENGVLVMALPGISSGSYAEGLVAAWIVARHAGDLSRVERYEAALAEAMEFLLTLQYTKKFKHFMPEYLARWEGAFFASLEDGSVRIDFTQHAICAMLDVLAEERVNLKAGSPDGSLRSDIGVSR